MRECAGQVQDGLHHSPGNGQAFIGYQLAVPVVITWVHIAALQARPGLDAIGE